MERSGARVVFSDGSAIEVLEPESLTYIEPDGRSVGITWCWQIGQSRAREIVLSQIRTWTQPHAEPLSADKKQEIARKVREFCRKAKIPLAILD